MKSSNQPGDKRKRILGFVLRVAISAVAIFFVFRKVSFGDIGARLAGINFFWLLGAIAVFNISKLISVRRIKVLLKPHEIDISTGYNFRVYFIGAFYNLFLPGLVSGDIFKVYLISEKYEKPVGKLVPVVLLDRFTGVVALAFFTVILMLLSSYKYPGPWFLPAAISAMILIYPVTWFLFSKLFKKYKDGFVELSLVSLVSQLLQVAQAAMLLKALHIQGNMADYLALYMISGLVSVLPISLGGLGAREWTFLFGQQYLVIDKTLAISFTLMVFSVTAISSLPGLFLLFKRNKE